jgi:phage shock protein A
LDKQVVDLEDKVTQLEKQIVDLKSEKKLLQSEKNHQDDTNKVGTIIFILLICAIDYDVEIES